MLSSSDMATRSLEPLIGAEEIPSAADLQKATEVYRSVFGMLPSLGVSLPNAGVDAFPEEFSEPMSGLVALFLQPKFNGAAPTTDQMGGYLAALRSLAAKPATGTRQRAEFY